MHQKVQRLHAALINRNGGPILLQNNVNPHVATANQLHRLNELCYEILPHQSYLPDPLSTNYHFFKHLNHFLDQKCFTSKDPAKSAFVEFVESRIPEFYKIVTEKLASRWENCINANECYLINKNTSQWSYLILK